MISRTLSSQLTTLRASYPVIAITGPRQSGKSTMAQTSAADLPFINLESPIERAEAMRDPIGFLRQFPKGAILDEVQHVPDLISHLQVRVDADRSVGQWIVTGSQQLELGQGIAQSLAGRVARLELLPFSHAELSSSPRQPRTLAEAVLRGGYPPLYDTTRPEPPRWLEHYLANLLDRDIRRLVDIRDTVAFDRFLHLCAARTGQVVNTNALGNECQVNHKTIAAWLEVLKACYVIRFHRPHHRNFGKRLSKSPKIYFLDSGLACRLLHITDVQQLVSHPNWGALVETWCMNEVLKSRLHRGLRDDLWFWRSSDGIEVDALIEAGHRLIPLEIKASETPDFKAAAGLRKLRELSQRDPESSVDPGYVIYGGNQSRLLGDDHLVHWHGIAEALETIP